jgi:hypothetical protein
LKASERANQPTTKVTTNQIASSSAIMRRLRRQ